MPATLPAVESYPSESLVAACRSEGQRLKNRLDGSFRVAIEPPFVVAGNLDGEQIASYTQWSVVRPAEAMWASYFRKRPDNVITVLLFADGESYRAWAKNLFGDEKVSYFGYYRHADRTLVMNIGTGTGTLVHELTHALIAYDWPDVPLWFNEGLASLHEQCQVDRDGIRGLPNWRLPALQTAIERNELRSLAELTDRDDFYGPLRGINYAHARYFCLYLQSRGLLRDFYKRYRASWAEKATAGKVIETVCGRPMAEIDKDFVHYVGTLKWPTE